VAALSLPSAMTESAKVASATEGAAPNKPAKLFGLKRSPSSENVETDIPPIKKRMRISFIMSGQTHCGSRQTLSTKPDPQCQARRVWTKLAAPELFTRDVASEVLPRIQRSPDHRIHCPEV
jgi:hypothetical protein